MLIHSMAIKASEYNLDISRQNLWERGRNRLSVLDWQQYVVPWLRQRVSPLHAPQSTNENATILYH